MEAVNFRKYYIENPGTRQRCRVHYSLDNRSDKRKCVTIYAKGYGDNMSGIIDFKNGTDYSTDYFEKDRAVIFEDSPLYESARKVAEKSLNPGPANLPETDQNEKIKAFAVLVEADQIAHLREQGLSCQGNIDSVKTKIKPGKKYIKVDLRGSGKFMVEVSTGNIFGIKGYGVIHRGKSYGNLDTISRYNWGGYGVSLRQ